LDDVTPSTVVVIAGVGVNTVAQPSSPRVRQFELQYKDPHHRRSSLLLLDNVFVLSISVILLDMQKLQGSGVVQLICCLTNSGKTSAIDSLCGVSSNEEASLLSLPLNEDAELCCFNGDQRTVCEQTSH
jgi:hypothetical protein